IRRAPAEPGCDRQALCERKASDLESVHALGERAGGLEHEVVGDIACGSRGRSTHAERQSVAWRQRQGIPDLGKGDQALDFMKAVGPAAEHAQRQIDLGGRFLAHAAFAMWLSRRLASYLPPARPRMCRREVPISAWLRFWRDPRTR